MSRNEFGQLQNDALWLQEVRKLYVTIPMPYVVRIQIEIGRCEVRVSNARKQLPSSRLIDSPKKSEPVTCAHQELFSFFKNDAKSKRGLQLSTPSEVARPAGFQTSLSVRQ